MVVWFQLNNKEFPLQMDDETVMHLLEPMDPTIDQFRERYIEHQKLLTNVANDCLKTANWEKIGTAQAIFTQGVSGIVADAYVLCMTAVDSIACPPADARNPETKCVVAKPPGEAALMLAGSAARGEMVAASDVDALIVHGIAKSGSAYQVVDNPLALLTPEQHYYLNVAYLLRETLRRAGIKACSSMFPDSMGGRLILPSNGYVGAITGEDETLSDVHVRDSVKEARLLVSGDDSVSFDFISSLNEAMTSNEVYSTMAREGMKNMVANWELELARHAAEPGLTDIKNTFYRPIQQAASHGIASLFGRGDVAYEEISMNTVDRIQFLVSRNYLNPTLGQEMIDGVHVIMGIRILC
jgi:hypothetical protein